MQLDLGAPSQFRRPANRRPFSVQVTRQRQSPQGLEPSAPGKYADRHLASYYTAEHPKSLRYSGMYAAAQTVRAFCMRERIVQ